MTEKTNLLILGAGFSYNAGLPLASGFTRELLNLRGLKLDGPSARQVPYIRKFVDSVFGEGTSRTHEEWPELEDIFTLLDLSANTGHHLGSNHSASELRVVRRSIIVRMIRMLGQAYRRRQKSPDDNWNNLEKLFALFDPGTTAVLSMNWDTVFETGIDRTQDIKRVEYGCDATPVRFKAGELRSRVLVGKTVTVLKPHGSVNWLYCDACRDMFWVDPNETEKVAETIFRVRDWDAIGDVRSTRPTTLEPACPRCGAKSLGTRFATFSYRKALDFPMHSASWRTAEELLKGAREWIFFGYSMPAADFEFKHLLKRVQLSKQERPRITVITGGDDADATVARFTQFYGDVAGERTFFKSGLDSGGLRHLQSIGVLKSEPFDGTPRPRAASKKKVR
jgi:hypothetical protein